MNSKVIYTSIFGPEYYLHDPEVKLDDWDFICFTDRTDFESDVWTIQPTLKIYDGARDSKKPKLLPHRYLQEYDKNFIVIGNLYHAEKAFIIFSVYNFVCEEHEQDRMNKETVEFHMDVINKFIRDEVQLSWKENNTILIEQTA